jgi:DNA-binding NarL/FixJ family response regulator
MRALPNLDANSTAPAQGDHAMPSSSDVNLPSPLRVVVADRHEATRSGIRAAVERAGFAVVAECGDGASATAAVVRHRAHVCLIDAELPGAGEAVAAIASLPLAPKVVVLGSAVDEHAFFVALEKGAAGYLLKDVDPGRLADELRSVAEGGTVLAPALAARLVEEFRRRSRRRGTAPAGLTDREWQVLELLADGLTTKEIALRLRVSATTVRRHISSAIKRIGAAGRSNAVEWTRGVQRSERE